MECNFYIEQLGSMDTYLTYDLVFCFKMFGCELNFSFKDAQMFDDEWKDLLQVPTVIKSHGKGDALFR